MRNLDNLIKQYVEAAILYGEDTRQGNTKMIRKGYKTIKKIYYKLKNNPDLGLSSLVPSLNNSDNFVRLAAAAQTLSIDPEKAEKVLIELSNTPNFPVDEARMTLQV